MSKRALAKRSWKSRGSLAQLPPPALPGAGSTGLARQHDSQPLLYGSPETEVTLEPGYTAVKAAFQGSRRPTDRDHEQSGKCVALKRVQPPRENTLTFSTRRALNPRIAPQPPSGYLLPTGGGRRRGRTDGSWERAQALLLPRSNLEESEFDWLNAGAHNRISPRTCTAKRFYPA